MPRLATLLPLLLAFSLTGCVIGGEPPPVPETAPAAPVTMAMLAPEPPPPPAPEPVLDFTWGPPVVPVTPVNLPARALPPAPPPAVISRGATTKTPVAAQSPVQIIEEANKAARIAPTARNYFGGGGTARYQWTAGRIFDVYLSPASGTRITFPPGEVLAHELVLNPDAFDVSSATITTELSKTTVLFIRPCDASEQGCKPVVSVDVALVSESGRSYDLHLIVGKVGMVAVTWAIAPIPNIQVEEPPPQGVVR
jgi:hypothetical protein